MSSSPSIAPADPSGEYRLSGAARAMLLVLCGAIFLEALDVSMVGVALPSIGTDLDMSTRSLQWVVSGYVLGYGGFLLLGGRTADLIGRRRVFLGSLAVFIIASALGGLADSGPLLVATRLAKGIGSAFTAPAGLSIITTSFAEGPPRNKALLIYTATGAAGFSFGLVFGGLLTEIGWRWVFFAPVPVALAVLLAGIALVPRETVRAQVARAFDVSGAVILTAAMLLLVFTVVEAPQAGWGSPRTLGSFAMVGAMMIGFVVHEARSAAPLVRLGIFRTGSLVRANLAAMALFGAYVGFQFIAMLYLQRLRGWSALETGLAIFPGGLLVAVLAPRVAPLVMRVGLTRLIIIGIGSAMCGYALFLRIDFDSTYALVVLPTVLLAGLGFALGYGPLNIAATAGVSADEQGLASGLVTTSFQLGGALVLAVVTAVNDAFTGSSPEQILTGFRAGMVVSVVAAFLGVVAIGLGRRQA